MARSSMKLMKSIAVMAACILLVAPGIMGAHHQRGPSRKSGPQQQQGYGKPASTNYDDGESPFTLSFKVTTEDKDIVLEAAKYDTPLPLPSNITTPALSLNRGTLPPCAVRVMHLHNNVDELYYAESGYPAVAISDQAGNIYRDVLRPGQSFVIPRNLVHTIYNPDCEQTAVFLSFLNTDNAPASNVNVAKAAFDINAGPFKAYADPYKLDSLNNAVGILAYDPVCLDRCNLGPKFGQEPASLPKDGAY